MTSEPTIDLETEQKIARQYLEAMQSIMAPLTPDQRAVMIRTGLTAAIKASVDHFGDSITAAMLHSLAVKVRQGKPVEVEH